MSSHEKRPESAAKKSETPVKRPESAAKRPESAAKRPESAAKNVTHLIGSMHINEATSSHKTENRPESAKKALPRPESATKNANKTETGPAVKKAHAYSFTGSCGPQTMPKNTKIEVGHYQSPINIETKKAVYDPNLTKYPLRVNYDSHSCFQIKNTGHTFQVDGFADNKSGVFSGPVKNDYNFLQFHMHWGDTPADGSEHMIDGKSYAAELHFVNWNDGKFKDPKSAAESDRNRGLIVLGVLIELGAHNDEFEKLASHFKSDIDLKGECVPISNINMMNLLPKNQKDYWTYPGSLTTPPFYESVRWIVFKEPLQISKEQLEKCHQLYECETENERGASSLIKYNDRPVCNLDKRVVHKSFH